MITAAKRTAMRAGMVVFLTLPFLAACGDDEGEHPQSGDPEREAIVQAIRDKAPEQQQSALADGVVAADEYEAAVLAVVSCMDQAGYASTIERRGELISIQGPALPSVDAVREWNAAHDTCATTWLRSVQEVWQLQHAPTQRELEARRAAMLDCVRDHEVDVESIEMVETLMGEGRLNERDRTAVLLCMATHMSSGADTSVLEARLAELDK